ncbi:MAG: hypothetical protein M5U12_30760 [Verrucomicrobia bacterium]|nr:hypothetical protein [Verrucomicrobiota bacterium]
MLFGHQLGTISPHHEAHHQTATKEGRIEWVLDVRKQGKRTRTFHPTKAAAESAAADIRDQWSVSGHSWATMPARERAEIVLVAEEIKQSGNTWREVWDFYRSAHPVGVPSLPLEEAIARFLEEKTAANRRPRYVEQMARFLRFFARGRERLPIGAVTREMLEQWVQGRRLRAGTQKNNYLLFGAFFSHALKRGWVARNPCRGIEHPRVERVPPRILAPAEARHLLGVCEARHPKLLAWVALGMFAGTRPEETDQLTWPKIDLARGLIQMDAAASKGAASAGDSAGARRGGVAHAGRGTRCAASVGVGEAQARSEVPAQLGRVGAVVAGRVAPHGGELPHGDSPGRGQGGAHVGGIPRPSS